MSSKREIRTRLRRAWERVSKDADPVDALRAGRMLRPLLARWERVLVGEALEEGITWQELGRALGVTRQAAWSRYRPRGRKGGGRRS